MPFCVLPSTIVYTGKQPAASKIRKIVDAAGVERYTVINDPAAGGPP
jgi:hypothetical protein